MAEIPYVCLYRSYYKELENFSPEQRGRLLWALLEYLCTGQEPELPDPERYFWPRLREQHLRDAVHYEETCERNRANGTKGGYAKAERIKKRAKAAQALASASESDETALFLASASEGEKTAPFLAVGPKEREKEKEKEKEKEYILRSNEYTDFSIPTFDEVKDYCTQEGLTTVDPQKFWDYYEMMGWQSGGKHIRDWKAALRLWNTSERSKAESKRGVSEDDSDESVSRWGTVV